mmetsp:Transcript_32383/g.66122  ORF Transcript_32383/g.66122 Transcript_32383/m.66122 type:complete len:296 (+) Transcript_32383:177-1064(+)
MAIRKTRAFLLVATLQYCVSFGPSTWAPTCATCSFRSWKNFICPSSLLTAQSLSNGRVKPTVVLKSSSDNMDGSDSTTSLPASVSSSEQAYSDISSAARRGHDVGGFDPLKDKIPTKRETANVGNPQTAVKTENMNIEKVLAELQAIQAQGPKKYCILGTRHCSLLHQQIVELLAYALVLSGNHVYTSGAQGTNAAAIRGALRAIKPHLLTVVLPQSMSKQTPESQELLQDVTNVVTMPQNDGMPLDMASRICNSHLLNQTDHLISIAFHESKTVIEASREAQKLDLLVTMLYLD